jgi:hypothetical protein
VPHLAGKNIVGCKWVYCIKWKADSSIDKYKAWLVAHRFTQIYGVNYLNTFSPVAKLASICMILTTAAWLDWEIKSFNFNGVYLNGELGEDEEIYMQEPPRYKEGKGQVKWLQKLLYGLKQARCKWYDALTHTLADLGLHITQADLGIFCTEIREHILIMGVHIDDCMITGSSAELITKYKCKLHARYALTDLGLIHWLLGIKIIHNHLVWMILLSQSSYIDSILAHFNLANTKV